MSAHNLGSQIEDARITTAGTSGRFIAIENSTPTDSVAGYARGCLWINTNSSATTTTRLYINAGSETSTSWKAFTHA
jgi:hypothetical protein